MTDLIAIAYPDTTTAAAAMDEVHRLESDLVELGRSYATRTGSTRPLPTITRSFWGLLFGCLFFVPVLGMAVGAGLGGLFGKIEKSGIDQEFINQVRGKLKPGTSALFMVVEKVTPDKAIEAK